ncbi:hypothetical protein [Lichenibacterium dinghuense]|uniref:hypothetical protein n=1 Tax=Lichenibacterium dinghuense TaxID=2895977 RepID=UPI001F285EFE|nr:hypothetical protein [Lichenibacterium sp. 6Y81]
MRRSRIPLLAASALGLASALGGCATGPNYVTPDRPPPVALSRTNGQPRWWPCMIGDALCKPQL